MAGAGKEEGRDDQEKGEQACALPPPYTPPLEREATGAGKRLQKGDGEKHDDWLAKAGGEDEEVIFGNCNGNSKESRALNDELLGEGTWVDSWRGRD